MAENTMGGCTGSCHSCASSCDTQTGERKPSFFDKYQVSFPDVYEIQLRNSWDFRNHIFLKSQLFFYLENGLASHRHS